MAYDTLADEEALQKTIETLKANGISALVVNTGAEAKDLVLKTIPEHSEVMTMTSVTLDTIGLAEAINESGKYDAVKAKLMKMDRKTQSGEMQKLGAAPTWTVGSVHAVTQDGKVLIASNTGSQLPAYVYGAQHVIWVVGTQKIVQDLNDGMQRIEQYVLPLESERAKKAYGAQGSNISKLLIINKEVHADRLTIVFVKEKLGY